MTPVILLEELQKRLTAETKDLLLPVRTKRADETIQRPPKVYKQQLPDKKAQTSQIPYILLKLVTGKDDQAAGDDMKNTCKIRMIIAVYDENAEIGEMALLSLISNIRVSLLEDPILSKQFEALKPLEYIIYPEDTNPYYLGEILTIWSLPEIKRKINI